MKKCTSCSKDLPDAALHCVFCGAKQAPAQPQAGLAKTVMGYSAQEMIAQIRQQGIPPGTPGAPQPGVVSAQIVQPSPAPAPAQPQSLFPAPSSSPQPLLDPKYSATSPTIAPGTPAPSFPAASFQPQAQAQAQGHGGSPSQPSAHDPKTAATIAPGQANNPQYAATMAPQQMNPAMMATMAPTTPFAPPAGNAGAVLGGGGGGGGGPIGGGPTGGSLSAHGAAPAHGPGPSAGGGSLGGGGVLTGGNPAVSSPVSTPAPTPSVGTPRAPVARVAGPIDRDDALRATVKAMMLVFGVLLVVQFVVPTSLDPLSFAFEGFKDIADLPVKAMIGLLIVPLVGIVAIIMSLLSIGTVVRGAIAMVLGLAGVGLVLWNVGAYDHIEWQLFALVFSAILGVTGLVIRSRFQGSLVARLLVTFAAAAAFATFLVPDHDKVPLVGLFDGLTSGHLAELVESLMILLSLFVSLLSLLVWLPAPSGAGAGVLAFAVLFVMIGGLQPGTTGFLIHFASLVFDGGGDIGDRISAAVKVPALGLLGWVPMTSFIGLTGWGAAGLLGRPSN